MRRWARVVVVVVIDCGGVSASARGKRSLSVAVFVLDGLAGGDEEVFELKCDDTRRSVKFGESSSFCMLDFLFRGGGFCSELRTLAGDVGSFGLYDDGLAGGGGGGACLDGTKA